MGNALSQIRLPHPRVLIAIGVMLALLLAGVLYYLTTVPSHAVSKPIKLSSLYWIYYREDLTRLEPLNPSLIGQTLSGPGAYALEHNNSGPPLPSGVTPIELFFSYATEAAAIKSGSVIPGVSILADDPEYWPATPVNEQQTPLTYMQDFSKAASGAGDQSALIPGRDLMSVPGATCGQQKGESIAQAYVRCNLPSAASSAKIFVLQTAEMETSLPALTQFVQQAAAAARAANPHVIILATLSTTPNNVTVGPGTINQAARAMLPYVQGFEVNTTAPTDSRFITFLQDLSGSSSSSPSSSPSPSGSSSQPSPSSSPPASGSSSPHPSVSSSSP